jgi:hypothetical protein
MRKVNVIIILSFLMSCPLLAQVEVVRDAKTQEATGVEQNGVMNGREYGIAILTHPDTPRSGDWYVMENRDFIYLNPAILLRGACKLDKGETLTLRYRLHVHRGRWDTTALNKAATDYNYIFTLKNVTVL